jgi:hypothetical protein
MDKATLIGMNYVRELGPGVTIWITRTWRHSENTCARTIDTATIVYAVSSNLRELVLSWQLAQFGGWLSREIKCSPRNTAGRFSEMSDKYDFISDFIFDYTLGIYMNLHPIKLTLRCYSEKARSIILFICRSVARLFRSSERSVRKFDERNVMG